MKKDCNVEMIKALSVEMGKLAVLDYVQGKIAKTPIDQIIKACKYFKKFLKPELIKKKYSNKITQ